MIYYCMVFAAFVLKALISVISLIVIAGFGAVVAGIIPFVLLGWAGDVYDKQKRFFHWMNANGGRVVLKWLTIVFVFTIPGISAACFLVGPGFSFVGDVWTWMQVKDPDKPDPNERVKLSTDIMPVKILAISAGGYVKLEDTSNKTVIGPLKAGDNCAKMSSVTEGQTYNLVVTYYKDVKGTRYTSFDNLYDLVCK